MFYFVLFAETETTRYLLFVFLLASCSPSIYKESRIKTMFNYLWIPNKLYLFDKGILLMIFTFLINSR